MGGYILNRRGSAAVLLTIVFSALLVLASVLFLASRSAAGRSYVDATLQLSGRAILSEYDRRLLSDYGLFAFRGDGKRIEEDIRYYAGASLPRERRGYGTFLPAGRRLRPFDFELDAVEVNLKQYSLMNVDVFESCILEASAAQWLKNLKGGGDKSGEDRDDKRERTLRKGSVIESLPSRGMPGFHLPDLSNLTKLPALTELVSSVGKSFATDEYVMNVFGHAVNGRSGRDTFFQNEVEYILSGKTGDRENYDSVKFKLSLLRMALNNASLIKDRDRMLIITEMAAPFTAVFGVGELAAAAIIFESWAAAETHNDLLRLEQGEKVALYKGHGQWATDNIGEIMDGVVNKKAIAPAVGGGLGYSGYLRILLALTDREVKLLRMMDLIQINLKGTYIEAFLIREYYAGFRLLASVNGDDYHYQEKY